MQLIATFNALYIFILLYSYIHFTHAHSIGFYLRPVRLCTCILTETFSLFSFHLVFLILGWNEIMKMNNIRNRFSCILFSFSSIHTSILLLSGNFTIFFEAQAHKRSHQNIAEQHCAQFLISLVFE